MTFIIILAYITGSIIIAGIIHGVQRKTGKEMHPMQETIIVIAWPLIPVAVVVICMVMTISKITQKVLELF